MTVMAESGSSKYFIRLDLNSKSIHSIFNSSSGSYTVNPDSSISVIAEEAGPLADFDKDVSTSFCRHQMVG